MLVSDFIKKVTNKKNKDTIRFFIDIENYKYNCKEGRKKPSLYKAFVYSLEVGFYYNKKLYTQGEKQNEAWYQGIRSKNDEEPFVL